MLFRQKDRAFHWLGWIGGAGFLDNVIGSIDFVVPRASVPVIAAHKIQYPWSGDIEADVEVVSDLIKEMAGISALVSTAPVIGAAHVGARADALVRPAFPEAIGIKTHRNDRWLFRRATEGGD